MSTSVFTQPEITRTREVASFGAVHLDVTNLERSALFWEHIVGLTPRSTQGKTVEFGTETETLVVLHPGAVAGFQNRHSGLYHLAIHPPTEQDFARILLRLIRAKWPISPTDHIMSKAIYMLDPDGITVEITLETPERIRKTVFTGDVGHIVRADGTIASGREPLDINNVLATLTDDDTTGKVPVGTKIGHVHLYVSDLAKAYKFYQGFGFNPAIYVPQLGLGDLGAGGKFNHRIAVNTWQGIGAPQSPERTARMRHFTLHLDTADRLHELVTDLSNVTETDTGWLTRDPAGNPILIAHPFEN